VALFLETKAKIKTKNLSQPQYLMTLTTLIFILLSPFISNSKEEAILIAILFVLTVLTWWSLHKALTALESTAKTLEQTAEWPKSEAGSLM
jgi:uncharacterized membrane protein YqjE